MAIGMLIARNTTYTANVLRFHALGCAHHPPVGDQTHFGYGYLTWTPFMSCP